MIYNILNVIEGIINKLFIGESIKTMIDTTVLNALISAGASLVVAMGTWHVSMKKDRDKLNSEIKKNMDEQFVKTQSDISSLKDDISQVNATVQNQIGIIDVRIDNLTKQVEKHNQVIERTYKLEQAVEDLKQIGA